MAAEWPVTQHEHMDVLVLKERNTVDMEDMQQQSRSDILSVIKVSAV